MEIQEIGDLLYNLKIANIKITKLFEDKIGISLTRYQMLIFLYKNQPATQIKLQEYLQIDQAAITRHLKVLVDKEYVKKKRNPCNNREILVTLTEKSYEVLNNCNQYKKSSKELFGEDFTKEDIYNLRKLLSKLNKNINF